MITTDYYRLIPALIFVGLATLINNAQQYGDFAEDTNPGPNTPTQNLRENRSLIRKQSVEVEKVICHASGMEIIFAESLPPPRDGMWDLEIEGFPKCPGASKTDVGGGHTFTIFYAEKELCGVEPKSFFTPSWVSTAQATLLLKDDNGTCIADSVSCVYNTRFETSLLTFSGQVKSQNLLYGGSLEEDKADVETTVHSINSVGMDFFNEHGEPLQARNVKLGDPIMFKIDVSENTQVTKVLPEHCYFSSSSIPEEKLTEGQTLTFIKSSCFNERNGMVKAFLPKMMRNRNGTNYEMAFPAFYFTEFGQNLFVHCTILACIGGQELCEPSSDCFATERRKRDLLEAKHDQMLPIPIDDTDVGYHHEFKDKLAKEIVMTKYIIVEDKRKPRGPGYNASLELQLTTANGFRIVSSAQRMPTAPVGSGLPIASIERALLEGTVCMQTPHFATMLATFIGSLMLLLIAVSCMGGRLARVRSDHRSEKRLFYAQLYHQQQKPPAYVAASLPSVSSTVTSF